MTPSKKAGHSPAATRNPEVLTRGLIAAREDLHGVVTLKQG